MGRILLKYIISFTAFSLSAVILLDYILLPNYVGLNNEHYLPDVRSEYLEKATYQLHLLGFNTELIVVPYSKSNLPGTVIKMFPRAFTKVKKGRTIDLTIAGKDQDIDIPEWFSYPEVVEELRHAHPPKDRRGFTIFFTGLSGSGKSTIANALLVKLLEHGRRRVTLLDGDIVRINLSSELGFTREHRDLNITRIGFVASEITKNGGIAICAPIAPYDGIRKANRENISKVGGYIEVHVSTPLEVCEKRDVKGLYAKARQGIIKGFTGIDDPYEVPQKPEIKIDTSNISQEEAVQQVLVYLKNEGYLA